MQSDNVKAEYLSWFTVKSKRKPQDQLSQVGGRGQNWLCTCHKGFFSFLTVALCFCHASAVSHGALN